MRRRDFLKTAMATAVLTVVLPVQAKKTLVMSNGHFADVNGQHIFYSVHGAGKPLILLQAEWRSSAPSTSSNNECSAAQGVSPRLVESRD